MQKSDDIRNSLKRLNSTFKKIAFFNELAASSFWAATFALGLMLKIGQH
jgi:hypothetical protein